MFGYFNFQIGLSYYSGFSILNKRQRCQLYLYLIWMFNENKWNSLFFGGKILKHHVHKYFHHNYEKTNNNIVRFRFTIRY